MFFHVFCVLFQFLTKPTRELLCDILSAVHRIHAVMIQIPNQTKSVLYCVLVGLAVELNSRALISVLPHQFNQPLISILYSVAAILMAYVYLAYKQKIILPLVIFNGLYGIIQIATVNDFAYTILQPYVWGGSYNFINLWRAVELAIIIKGFWDGGIFNIISNFIRDTRSRNRGDRIVHFIWR